MQKIGIVGAGAWGTALAQLYCKNKYDVLLWAREEQVVHDINENHENKLFLKGHTLDTSLKATQSLSDLSDRDIVMVVTPAQYIRDTLSALRSVLKKQPLIICSKGLEIKTGALMSQIAQEEVPDHIVGIMTGPTFASDIIKEHPSAVTLAIKDKDIGQRIIDNLNTRTLRLYPSDDLIGAQIGGAIKNVIAIACGVAHGLNMGESTRAALMTRGLAEMARLVSAMDGKKVTLMGMCGFGDLVLTCNSMQSRNFSLGVALGEGQTLDDILGARNGKCVTEGYYTAKALKKMADLHAVDMPISLAVYECLHEGKPINEGIADLLDRPVKSKFKK